MSFRRFATLLIGWRRHRKLLMKVKGDYRKVGRIKLNLENLFSDEEDQLFIRVDREL